MRMVREVEIEAPPEDVWEALATEEGRERWLGDGPADVEIESYEPHHHLVWWWREDGGEPSRVEFRIVAVPAGSRVLVTETAPPRVPVARLAASLAMVAA